MIVLIVKGKFGQAIIYSKNIEKELIEQTTLMLDQPFAKDMKIRIMPDCHVGLGSVIGFTAEMGDMIIPNIVGVDIGCGILTVNLGDIDIDLVKLDDFIRKNIPLGFKVQDKIQDHFPLLKELTCYDELKDVDRLRKSIGSLGGGNHFIEICVDDEDNKYLLIHSGSRNLGTQVAEIHQKKAIEKLKDSRIPRDLRYLEKDDMKDYLKDMEISQKYASLNRFSMARIIIKKYLGLKLNSLEYFETVHNYVNFQDNIIRKGAVSAKEGEFLLIPMNMRDGAIICKGKGNPDWNYSAPHGAGRIYSRKQAREKLCIETFKEDMENIYTTSVSGRTLDESPRAYKPMEEIIEIIGPTVEIIKIIKPIYNIKG